MSTRKTAQQPHTDRTATAQDPHTDRTAPAQGNPYLSLDDSIGKHTAVALAQQFEVADVTVRTRWHRRVSAVIGEPRTKVSGRYTDLARALLADYAGRVAIGGMPPDAWETEMRGLFSEPGIQARPVEVVPTDAALALRSNGSTLTAYDDYIASLSSQNVALTIDLDELIEGQAETDQALLIQEIEAATKRGAQEGAILYAAQKKARNEVQQALKQRELDTQRRVGGQS